MKFIEWYVAEKQGAAKAYSFFRPKGAAWDWAKVVWKPCLMPKHRLTLWLLAHGRLRTKDRIPYEANKTCPLCKHADETCAHTFFQCPISMALWTKVKIWLGIRQEVSTSVRLLRLFRRTYRGNGRLTKARYLGVSCMIFLLWQARNRCQYEGDVPNIDRMFCKIQTHVYRFVDI